MPELSIIIPIYNVAKYLPTCLDSVSRQQFSDFEVLCIDDGSQDQSGCIIDAYARKDARFIAIHQNNQGVSQTRNNGLDLAKGDYISFIDADDYIEPDMFRSMLDFLKSHDVDICACGIKRENWPSVENSTVIRPERTGSVFGTVDVMRYLSGTSDANELILYQSLVNKVFARHTFKNIRFEGTIGEDCAVINTMFSNNYSIAFIDNPYYIYVNHPSSKIHNANCIERIRFLDIYKARWKLYSDRIIVQNARKSFCNIYLFLYVQTRKQGVDIEQRYRNDFFSSLRILKKKGDISSKLALKAALYAVLPDLYYFFRKKEK